MGTFSIQSKYNTQQKCIAWMEEIRWGKNADPACAHCGSAKSSTKRSGTNIYHCNKCNNDFTVLIGTIFEHTRTPLPKWFQLISLMMEAKKGISSSQLSRNIEVNYATAWYMAMRVRCAMIEDIELDGFIEADETYLGGKPRKKYQQNTSNTQLSQESLEGKELDINNSKRGRGTSKTKVAGMVERKGRIVLKMMEYFNTATLVAMLKRYVNTKTATVVTDEARFYNKFEGLVEHLTIKHKESFAKGNVHINTVEGFWSIIKAGLKGQYRSLSKKYLPFYLSEFAYRYNRRNSDLIFESFMIDALSHSKCFLNQKPIKEVNKIVYPKKTPNEKLP